MDKNTIFVKTKEGDEAVRQRTRLVQRNLRNILIMVDGYSTVAELARRFGDAAVVENSLAELEHGGFVEDVMKQAVPRMPGAASPLATEPGQDEIPLLTAPASDARQAAPPAAEPPGELTAARTLEEQFGWDSRPMEREESSGRAAAASWVDAARESFGRAGMRFAAKPKPTQREAPEDASGKGDSERLKTSVRGGPGWFLLIVFALGGVISVLVLVILLFPYERYLPDIERQAAESLHDQVRIGRIGFSFLPRPNIALAGVEVGKDRYLVVGTIRAVPDFFSLFGERKVLHELQLDGVAVRKGGLEQIAKWGGGKGGTGRVDIRHVSLSGMSVVLGDAAFDGIGGELSMTEGGAIEAILLHNGDSSLKLDVRPQNGKYKLAISGNAWKTPFAPGLAFDSLEARGELGPARLDLASIDGRLYDGFVAGSGSVDWSRDAVLSADIELKRLNLAKLLPVFSPDLAGEGELSGKIRLASKADAPGKLKDNLRANASFDVRRGAMKGFDLGEAVRNIGRTPTRGGITRFEQFAGNLQLDQQAYRLSNLRLSSGLMKSGGYLNISKDQRLNGVMEVEFKGSATLIKAPVAIGGTVKEPLLMPTRGSMAGAAVGTLLLGPGLGTAIGARAGSGAEGQSAK